MKVVEPSRCAKGYVLSLVVCGSYTALRRYCTARTRRTGWTDPVSNPTLRQHHDLGAHVQNCTYSHITPSTTLQGCDTVENLIRKMQSCGGPSSAQSMNLRRPKNAVNRWSHGGWICKVTDTKSSPQSDLKPCTSDLSYPAMVSAGAVGQPNI